MSFDHVRATGALLLALWIYQVVSFARRTGRRALPKPLAARVILVFFILSFILWLRAAILLAIGDARALEGEAFFHGQNALARGTGLILFLIGNGVMAWARIALGRELRPPVLKPDAGSRLILAGPYARIRHPIYLGDILIPIGLALIVGSWTFFVPALGILFLLPRVTALEEALLVDSFGEAYVAYQSHSHRLIPGVW